MEIWKDIPGYEGYYQVSNLGNVKSLDRKVAHKKSGYINLKGENKKLSTNYEGYLCVSLCKDSFEKNYKVHQLVAMAFLNHIPNGNTLVVNHKNFIRSDNRVENLEIVTMRVNGNKKHLKSKSKYTGVTWEKDRNKWTAQITFKKKKIRLGSFDSEYNAHICYQKALLKIQNKTFVK